MCFQGLEAQLLGIVVRKERPELEEQKDSLVINIAAGKKKLKELEDEILRCDLASNLHWVLSLAQLARRGLMESLPPPSMCLLISLQAAK